MEKTELSHFSISMSGASTYKVYHILYIIKFICCILYAIEFQLKSESLTTKPKVEPVEDRGTVLTKRFCTAFSINKCRADFEKKKNHKI